MSDRFLKCPFCGAQVPPPEEMKAGLEDIEGGRCSCGAVYVFDHSGRKMGEAYSNALLLAYEGDYDKAFSAPEGDYQEAVIRYHQRLGKYIEGEGGRMDKAPKFLFLKRKTPA